MSHRHHRLAVSISCAVTSSLIASDAVFAQTCPISANTVTLTTGQCSVSPGTTLAQTGDYATIVTAINGGTVVDLTPGAALIGNGFLNVAVQMLNGGVVRLGSNTPITLNRSNANPAY